MDNWDGATPWLKKQARWSIPDMTQAIHLQCKFCNDAEVFTDGNDCVSHVCPIFPYRPGTCRPEVNGVKRASRRATTHGFAPGERSLRQGKAKKQAITPEGIPGGKGWRHEHAQRCVSGCSGAAGRPWAARAGAGLGA